MPLKIRTLSCAFLLCGLVAACASAPPRSESPKPINAPIDAFETVGKPTPIGGPQSSNDNLSSDIQRLQNAHRTYQHAMQRRAAEIQRKQAECRAQPGSREVRIEDGSGDPNATYCQPASGSGGDNP